MPGRVLVRASQTVTCSDREPRVVTSALWLQSQCPPPARVPPAQPLCLPPAGSAGWQTATGHHLRLEGARCALRPAHCSPRAPQTRQGLPHTGKGSLGRWQRSQLRPRDSTARKLQPPSAPAVLPEATAALGAGTHTEPRGSSQPHRLLKVIRAFSTWKRGISVRRKPGLSCLTPTSREDPRCTGPPPHQS